MRLYGGGVILIFVAFVLFAGCSVYSDDGSDVSSDSTSSDASSDSTSSDVSSESTSSDVSSDSTSSDVSSDSTSSDASSDSTSSVGYTVSDLAGSYTGSSTLNAKLLEIMQNCTDPAWTEWLPTINDTMKTFIETYGFKTTGVTSTTLTLSEGSSFVMNIIYQSTLTTYVYQQDGELEISGTWSVSGSDLTFTYTASNVEDDWDTAPEAIVGIIRTLVNGSAMWTDGSNLYGSFGYDNYWTDSSATLFTK